jgi:hypothetical protein
MRNCALIHPLHLELETALLIVLGTDSLAFDSHRCMQDAGHEIRFAKNELRNTFTTSRGECRWVVKDAERIQREKNQGAESLWNSAPVKRWSR